MRKFLIGIAALTIFCSCQKEMFNQAAEEGVRMMTFKFDNNSTRTYLGSDGLTPKWSVGDVIRVMDDTGYEDITITSSNIESMTGESITLPTSLKGDYIYAVYPASATDMTSCGTDEIKIEIPSIQDGTFKNANICVALNDPDNVFIFRNATAILKVSQTPGTSGILGVKIEAEQAVAGEYSAFVEDVNCTVDYTRINTQKSGKCITACAKEAQENYYIAVPAGVETGAVKISYLKADTYATASKTTKTFALNTIYNIGNVDEMSLTFKSGRGVLNGHEFVEIAGLKWATENVAISRDGKRMWMKSSHILGDYFQWGATELLYDSFHIDNIPADDNDPAFYFKSTATFWSSAKNLNKDVMDETEHLKLEYDAARQHWGATWRTPKGGDVNEFETLYKATYWVRDEEDLGYYVFAADAQHPAGTVAEGTGPFYKLASSGLDKKDALIFFPATGMSKTSAVANAGQQGRYWMNNWNSDSKKAGRLYLTNKDTEEVRFKTQDWFYGSNIRPVSD